ncbi:TPM domain-containing protein [Hymenobacter rubidus]|uniref:TPM domain-containing protein n=1 Tax=Hymenobacter rubidus TaxID=1441626 RepID=UPI00191F224F|nr:TPM domain-containing protein [Hymenobacter rubidus]
MSRFLLLAFLFLSAGLNWPALAQTDDLPPRPTPFKFVNDQAQLMAPADAKKLESGLRRYADNTGTQVVVVTVPSLGGRTVADYGRALGTAWGVGQRDKNNGVVVLLSAQEHQVTIQPGNGLSSTITPEVTRRIIGEMTPGFKQGNYFAGLRAGLNTLMVTANPSSDPRKNQPAATANSAAAGSMNAPEQPVQSSLSQDVQTSTTTTSDPIMNPPAEPASSGPGMGTLLLGALIVGGVLWLVVRMFRSRSAASANQAPGSPSATPNFYPNRPNAPAGGFGQAAPGNYGPGYGNMPNQSSGPGIGGMLATGAAAAAGAYLGNRMASGHDTSGNNYSNNDGNNPNYGAGAAGAGLGAAGTAAGDDYFASRNAGADTSSGPDYFSDSNTAADNQSDYFSSDDNNSSYDDTSSGDSGGGGFDSSSDNSGSW